MTTAQLIKEIESRVWLVNTWLGHEILSALQRLAELEQKR